MNLKKKAMKETKRVRDVGYSGRQRRTGPIARVAAVRNTVYLQHAARPEGAGPLIRHVKGL